MKAFSEYKTVYIFLLSLIALPGFTQNFETVKEILIQTNPDKSYYVNAEGRIRSSSSTGVTVGGSNPFFIKVNSMKAGGLSFKVNFVREENFYTSVSSDQQILELKTYPGGTSFRFFDGLGTNVQTIQSKSSPQKWDLVTFQRFDIFGRQPKKYLPYTINSNGVYRVDPETELLNFYSSQPYVAKDAEPYAIQETEPSPMNRDKVSFSPGWKWHHDAGSFPTDRSYKVNSSSEVFRIVLTDGIPTYNIAAYWPVNSLQVTETKDERGLIERIYKDLNNRIILERRISGSVFHDTYYIYDIRGNLIFIFPPEASARLNEYAASTNKTGFLDKWCFQNRYDQFQRISGRKLPGGGWSTMYYDRWDRLVLSQDANQRNAKQWNFTKYDIHNRPVITGLISGDEATLVAGLNSSVARFESRANNNIGYTNNTFPSHSATNILTINYYDCYNFIGYAGWNTEALNYEPTSDGLVVDLSKIFRRVNTSVIYDPVIRGKLTGTRIKVLDQNKWLSSVIYYDRKYNVVQKVSGNMFGLANRESFAYNEFTGDVLKIKQTLAHPSGTTTLLEENVYDHAGRLLHSYHQINSNPRILMASYLYNELGQMIRKKIHSSDGVNYLQSIDYGYNIQGWLTNINNSTLTADGIRNFDSNDLFGLEILYNESAAINNSSFVTQKYYNGNVSAIKWKTNTKSTNTTTQRIYGFNYDGFNRFLQSYYASDLNGLWNGTPAYYNETVVGYDRNGNIGGHNVLSSSLVRNSLIESSSQQVDNLIYRYDGNQLRNVKDNSANNFGFKDKAGVDGTINEFNYDGNGNLVGDDNKSISKITYNHLNLPTVIEFQKTVSGVARIDKLFYTYDALGNKLRKDIQIGGTTVWSTDFMGPAQYDKGVLSFIATKEGRAVPNAAIYDYEYLFKDHQNNVRVVYGSAKEINCYRATMETALDNDERNIYGFRNITETRFAGPNYTLPSSKVSLPNKSARCNSFYDGITPVRPVGPAKSLKVSQGDVLLTEVYARFNTTKTSSNTITAQALASAVASTFAVTSVENYKLWQGLNTNVPISAISISATTIVPKAYLMILYFDDYFNFRKASVKGITEKAYGAFEKLELTLQPDVDGYVYIYVANETSVSNSTDVFFDEFYIIHQKKNYALQVFQASDYYPLGLSFNEYNADRLRQVGNTFEPVMRNRVLFQEQEFQKDLDLNWYQYKYRMHDPAIGRFGTIDPLAQEYVYNSPYAFSENILTQGIELEGLESKRLFETIKYFSPVAWNWNVSNTTHETKIGLEISVGLPRIIPFSVRKSFGASANINDIIQHKHVYETRTGTETSYLGLASFQSTTYRSGETSQTTGMVTLGNSILNAQYENDWFDTKYMRFLDPFNFHPKFGGDGGDRFRTAALQLNAGPYTAGFKLATGDPGFPVKGRPDYSLGGKKGTYVPSMLNGQIFDPNRYRLGLGYVGFGGFQIGVNNELIRHQIQNIWTHDNMNPPSPWFMTLPSNNDLYFGYSTGTGTQW